MHAGIKKRVGVNSRPVCLRGGEPGIRTPDTLVGYTRLAGEHLRPLGQLSVDTETILILKYGAKRNDTFTERFLQGGC